MEYERFQVKYSISGWTTWLYDSDIDRLLGTFSAKPNEHGTADDSAITEAEAMAEILNNLVV